MTPHTRWRWRYIALLILPFAHILLCAAAYLGFIVRGDEGIWSWVIVLWVDRPISDMMFHMHGNVGSVVILGTLWWFFLNIFLYRVVIAISRSMKRHTDG
jgi:hypothetical protein